MKDSKNQKRKSAGASGLPAPADSSHTSVPAPAFLEGKRMKINEDHIGTTATKSDAEKMIAFLTGLGYDVEYGSSSNPDETLSEISDENWQSGLKTL